MTENKDKQEQSMEEILASIRKIISEEESDKSVTTEKDEILELTEVVGQDTEEYAKTNDILELTEIISDASVGTKTELEREGTFDEQSNIQSSKDHAETTELDPFLQNKTIESTYKENVIANDVVEELDNLEASEKSDRGLVDDKNAELINASLSKLSAIDKDKQIELGSGVKENNFASQANEIMRPMIKKWLDENLADLVENLVRDEIQRLSQKSSQQKK